MIRYMEQLLTHMNKYTITLQPGKRGQGKTTSSIERGVKRQ